MLYMTTLILLLIVILKLNYFNKLKTESVISNHLTEITPTFKEKLLK